MGALRKSLGSFQFLTIAIGCMIGIGWITLIGTCLARAGPLGSILGFVIGGIVITGVAACYAELTGMMPASGGEVVFADRVFGRGASFFVGWFLVLMAISAAAFEALSFVWVATTLAPWIGSTPLYKVLGEVVTVQQITLGAAVLGAMYAVNRVGVQASSGVQDALTVTKLFVMVVFIVTAIALGSPTRIVQLASPADQSPVSGVLWVVATSAFYLGGFQVISQAAEERNERTSLRTIGRITTGSVLIGLTFYIGVIVAVTAAAPVEITVGASLPAAAAADAAFRSTWGSTAVLVAGVCGILATLNAMLLSGSRLSLALARFGFLMPRLAVVDSRGAPAGALTIVTLFALLGVFAGRGLLLPVVDTASMSLLFAYLMVCAAVLWQRTRHPETDRPFRVPGGLAYIGFTLLGLTGMVGFLMIDPVLHQAGVPIQWWLFLSWAALGTGIWFVRRGSAATP